MRIASLTLLVLISGCASTPDPLASMPVATEEEKSAAQSELIRCVEANTKKLDDKVSPANVVAEAVATSCYDPYAIVYRTQTQGLPPAVRNGFAGPDWNKTKIRMTTSYVLAIRAREAKAAHGRP